MAIHAAEKLIENGALVVTLSNSRGVLMAKDGITADQLEKARRCRSSRQHDLADLDGEGGLAWEPDGTAWEAQCEVALPCATQNELNGDHARRLVDSGCRFVAEGANMPCTQEAITHFHQKGALFGPG